MRRLWRKFLHLAWPQLGEAALSREIQAHLGLLEDEFVRGGLDRDEARLAARRAFGGVEQAKELHRRERSIGWLDDLRRDLRFARRSLASRRGLTAITVLTLALGIGANAAVFQLIDALALRPLPVRDPVALAEVRITGGNGGFGIRSDSYAQLTRPAWYELRRHQQAFSGVFAWGMRDIRVGERTDLRRAAGIAVSGEFFRVLGLQPYLGRLLEPSDEAAQCPPSVAVVSYSYWQREMGSRRLDAGVQLRVNLDLVDVVGVTPPGFEGVAVGDAFDIALPLCAPKELRNEIFDVAVMGRLRPGWDVQRATTHLNALSPGIFAAVVPAGYSSESTRRFKAFRLAAYPAATGVSALRTRYGTSLQLLFGITVLVLLIACANLANLMLARGDSRRREMAVRAAMGASRVALARQLLVESGLMVTLGTLLAIIVSRVLGRVLVASLATSQGAPVLPMPIDWRVLLFAVLVAAGTCLGVGLAAAARLSRAQPMALGSGGRGMTPGSERLGFQRLTVITQVAMSLVMLVTALLFVRSFRALTMLDPGMRRDGVIVGAFRFPESLPAERIGDFRRELLAYIASAPDIASAGTTTRVPLTGGSWGHDVRVGAATGNTRFAWVSHGYFDAMGIPIVKGRDISLRDTGTSPRVAVVNVTFVRRFIGAADPIGRTLQTSPEPLYPSTVYEIVGVIPDTAYNDVRGETPPMVFAPDSQDPAPRPGSQIVMYPRVPTQVALERIRRHVGSRYPDLVVEYTDLGARVQDTLVRERLLAIVAALFGVLAVALTIVGLYGVMSYVVTRRQPEMGLRLALGASGSQLLAGVMAEGGALLAAGVAIGLVSSLAAGSTVSALLFGVTPTDPSILAASCGVLGGVAALACYLPARRAARLDPVAAMRGEQS